MTPDAVLPFALNLAREAADILKQGRAGSVQVDFKSERDPVCEMDRRSESHILKAIASRFPKHRILSEETGDVGLGDDLWIVDPLDGTVNYIHGHPTYAVSLALVREGETRLGVICVPETGDVFHAVRGHGAFRNGEPISVSSRERLLESVLATGFAYNRNHKRQNNVENFARLMLRCRGVRRCGAATVDLAYVAAGVFDGFWELYLRPWDVAAGELLVREAGGRVTDFSGATDHVFGLNIVATNGRIHDKLREHLAPFVDEDLPGAGPSPA